VRECALTQAELAESLDVAQGSVSKVENQADMYLSTLRKYVHALGGELRLTVEFPDGNDGPPARPDPQILGETGYPGVDSTHPQRCTFRPPRAALFNRRSHADSIRKSENTKGRSYPADAVEPKWLAEEIVQHCKMQGRKSTLHDVGNGNAWLLQANDCIAVLVEAANRELVVKVMDQWPVRMKTCLTLNGLLALTGAVVAAAALTGLAAWRDQA